MKWVLTALLVLWSSAVLAQTQASQLYTTGYGNSQSATGTENSGLVKAGDSFVLMGAFLNYDTASAKVVMLFDSPTLPANGATPKMAVVIPAASSSVGAGMGSLSVPLSGVEFRKGITWACSTTGKLLTVDGTIGGNCYAQIVFQ